MRWIRGRGRRPWGRRGVAEVVGALLVLLIVAALVGLAFTQWIPAAMAQEESAYLSGARAALDAWAGSVDNLASGSVPGPITGTIPLASSSVPLVARPTMATLAFLPSSLPLTLRWNVSGRLGGPVGLPALALSVPNRYTPPATLELVGDAGIATIGGVGPQPFSAPLLLLRPAPGGWAIDWLIVVFTGPSFATAGGASAVLTAALVGTSALPANGSAASVAVTAGGAAACAYVDLLGKVAAAAGVPASQESVLFHDCGLTESVATWTIGPVASFLVRIATVSLAIRAG